MVSIPAPPPSTPFNVVPTKRNALPPEVAGFMNVNFMTFPDDKFPWGSTATSSQRRHFQKCNRTRAAENRKMSRPLATDTDSQLAEPVPP